VGQGIRRHLKKKNNLRQNVLVGKDGVDD